ncbi:hypothetical protein BDW68DRAFT_95913 [Aspergillus falconensis]
MHNYHSRTMKTSLSMQIAELQVGCTTLSSTRRPCSLPVSDLSRPTRVGPGYGFQYAHGLVLPALLTSGPTPLRLLQRNPAKLVDNAFEDIIVDYRIRDYCRALRVETSAATKLLNASQVGGYTGAIGWDTPSATSMVQLCGSF